MVFFFFNELGTQLSHHYNQRERKENEQPAIQELNGVIKQAKQILMLVNHEQGFPR